jgi:hypothetical protein
MGTGHIHKGTGTVPLPDSRYGCGSRTLISRFPHPDCRPALYQLRRQSSQLPPSYRFPPLREGNHKGSVPPASRGNLMEGVRNSPLLEHLQPCPHKPLPFRRESIPRAHESIPCGRESTHCGRESMHCERESTHCGRESMHCGARVNALAVGYPIPCPLMGQGATQVALGVQFDMPARFDEERGVGLKDEGGSGDALAWA